MKSIIDSIRKSFLLAIGLLAFSACTKDSSTPDPINGTGSSKFFIAATTGSATYMLTADDLSKGELTTTGNGIELPRLYSSWVTNGTKAVVGLIYAQGDPGIGISYGLNAGGQLSPVGNEFQITSRFTTYGAFKNYVLAGVSGQTLTNGKIGSVFNFIDLDQANRMSQRSIVTENITGNGEMATFSGVVDFGNGEFLSGLVVSSPKDPSQGGGGSTGKVNYPDSVWVAALDENLNVKRIYRDNRLSYSAGRYRSAYYSQISGDDAGNVYVFSGAYESTTTKPAGALRINRGADRFDQAYYFNIQDATGGYRFRKVWHISADYYLLEIYNDLTYTTLTPATQYAIVKMQDKRFTWLRTGFPAKDRIKATGEPFSYDGKLYFPVTTDTAAPTIYVIDPATATATAGLVVQADAISAISRLTY